MGAFAEWISGKVFRHVHGNNLVYNTCWEDPRLDKVALELTPEDNLLVITSAGCNALSYAIEGLNRVYAVDMNHRQNAVLELKIAGIKELDYETFFQLFGEGRLPGVYQLYRDKLRAHLSEKSQEYWDEYIKKFFDNKSKTYYFCGTSGYLAKWINRLVNLRGMRPQVDALINAPTLEEQQKIWGEVRDKFWSPLMRFIVNRDSTMSMVGVPKDQRKQIEKTYGQLVPFVQECLDNIFGVLPIQDNYFWRLYATGRYTKTCCPEYLEKSGFETLKAGAVDNVVVRTNTVEGFLRENPDVKISRFVLLDHMDWLSDKLFDALVSEWDAILTSATPGARVLWRSGGLDTSPYLHRVPVKVNGEEKLLGDILKYNKELAAELHPKCRVHTYGSFYIADLLNG
ncbi:MAG: BtaA family protein [Thermoguttaceae bacterium]|nr:BtaA family protein [Thermoguttaceae bacterium]MBQ8285710.1 BtaA family protein [Thermoguttaceae bacterium]